MGVAILTLWFIPGIIVRRIAENRYNNQKQEDQNRKIARLYPKEKWISFQYVYSFQTLAIKTY